jgi:DNA-binding SARP family transcriptional activator
VEIRLLGALEVLDRSGVPVTVAGAKLRALLALLAIHSGRVVSVDRLVDALWGAEAGETARNSLQVLVSKLRRALPEDVVATRPPGYVLDIPPGSVDVARFRHLAAEGRGALAGGAAHSAAALFHQALGLWRGEALADFAYDEFAREEISRLSEGRLTVVEERVEADLACGRHADLVPELEAAVRVSPLRERIRSQLMLALYRSGRQAEALRQYQDARQVLGDELGLEPGPELRSLEKAILSQSPSLIAAPAAPATSNPAPAEPSAPVPPIGGISPANILVGRDKPLAQLCAALARAQAGARSVVLVSGESGIGKTELVPDAALLATIAQSFGPARKRAGTARDRLLLLDSVCRWLEAVAATTPVVVVLDDLQWADGSTLSLLDLTARSPQPAALSVIGCYRPGELGEPARARLPLLATAVEHIELGGLDREAVAALISRTGTVPSADVDEIYRRTGGHPVFTRELALVWAHGEPASIPAAVRDTIELRGPAACPTRRAERSRSRPCRGTRSTRLSWPVCWV